MIDDGEIDCRLTIAGLRMLISEVSLRTGIGTRQACILNQRSTFAIQSLRAARVSRRRNHAAAKNSGARETAKNKGPPRWWIQLSIICGP